MGLHVQQAIKQMREALDHEAIRDTNVLRGYRWAATFALWAQNIIAQDPEDEHADWLRLRLADMRAWLRIEEFEHIQREDVWADIERVLKPREEVEGVAAD